MGALIGVIIFVVGVILFIGNVSGWWPTFPYAGFITMAIGGFIARVSNED